uniref:Carbamoyl-phosphate synthase large chain n=1 Tax=Escherichia coli TaxID=562 RepID=A0A1U9XH62_ECOLX|nr:hypothetical protein pGD80-2_00186 [Escherichia coli]
MAFRIIKKMNKKIWFMEGLSSQRDIIQGVKSFAQKNNFAITVFASHRNERHEILSVADYSLTEPEDPQKRLQFIQETIQTYGIHHIHTGRNSQWFEEHRSAIESTGATLTTGATGVDWLTLADEKVTFAQFMEQNGLPGRTVLAGEYAGRIKDAPRGPAVLGQPGMREAGDGYLWHGILAL